MWKANFHNKRTYDLGITQLFNFRTQVGQLQNFLFWRFSLYIFLQYILNQIPTQIVKWPKLQYTWILQGQASKFDQKKVPMAEK